MKTAVAAVAGLVWCVVLTPFMASVWVYGDGGRWEDATLVERTFGPMLEAAGLLSFGEGDLPYHVFGKGFFLVYVLMLPAVAAARARARDAGAPPAARRSAHIMYAAVWAALVGDIASYWGMSLPGGVGELLWNGGFMVELLGLLVLAVAMLAYGVSAARAGHLSRAVGWTMVAAVIAVVPVSLLVTGYLPNGVVLPLSAAWAVWAARVPRNAPAAGRLSSPEHAPAT